MSNDKLTEQLSAYFDGELTRLEKSLLLKQIESDSELKIKLGRYQLIEDIIKNQAPGSIDLNFHDRVSKQLISEPAYSSGASLKGVQKWIKPVVGVAIAASVAIVAIVSVQNLQYSDTSDDGNNRITQIENVDEGTRWAVKRQEVESRLNSLLFNHYETTSNNSIRGMLPFAPFVVYDKRFKDDEKLKRNVSHEQFDQQQINQNLQQEPR